MPAKKHEWLYTLPKEELERIRNGTCSVRFNITPAEKSIATILLKTKLNGPRKQTPAELRSRMLGMYKYQLLGMVGKLNSLHSSVRGSMGKTDIPEEDMALIKHYTSTACKCLQETLKKVDSLTATLSKYSYKAPPKPILPYNNPDSTPSENENVADN